MTRQTLIRNAGNATGSQPAGARRRAARRFVVAGLAAASAAMVLGTGTASADDPHDSWDGKTYGKAAAAVSNYYTPVIASKIGDQVPAEECIVVSSERSQMTDSRGRKRSKDYYFHLNCQLGVAGNKPGNSVTSEIGQKTKADQASARALAARLEKNPDTCNKSENSYNWCVRLCDRTKMCEVPEYDAI
ncbi:MAG: hypothetical protein E6Q56_10590 [Mycobacterium sp.]|nr:MAG: hypothetical protein E6Q56_10590 [Mycobacterium sp.]